METFTSQQTKELPLIGEVNYEQRRRRRTGNPLFALALTGAIVAGAMSILSAFATTPASHHESQTVDVRPVETTSEEETPTQPANTGIANVDTLFDNPYDWNNLHVDEKGRYSYRENGETVSRSGIDVSEHQQAIDWKRVADDDIEFAFIRIGYRGSTGALGKDEAFDYNLQQARAAGLDVGVYFYSLATTAEEAREEASFAVKLLEGAQLDYPIVFDIEPSTEDSERLSGLTKDTMTEIALAFCEEVEAEGYNACVYGNQTDLSRFHLMRLAERGFWYAQYDRRPTMALRFALWQYTQHGTVDGIDGYVDLDLDLTTVFNE